MKRGEPTEPRHSPLSFDRAERHTLTVIPTLVATVLAALGGLHIFWACGGTWGVRVAVPEVSGRLALVPSKRATLLVALALFAASGVALLRGFFLFSSFPGSPAHWASVLLGLVFLVRAVGDFRLIGFFKRVRGTAFATWDTRLFSLLSAALAAGFFWIAAS